MATTAVTANDVRAWAQARGYEVGDRGRIPTAVTVAFNKAHKSRQFVGSPWSRQREALATKGRKR